MKKLQWLSDLRQMPVKLMGLMTLLSLGFLFVLLSYSSTGLEKDHEPKYLYWGDHIDCPGKHCESCAGLGHQESSLRCALEEAIVLGRYFCFYSSDVSPISYPFVFFLVVYFCFYPFTFVLSLYLYLMFFCYLFGHCGL